MNRISIVLCTYNGERFLAEQLDSLLRQTHPADEIIIQDDGSDDRTMQIATHYAHVCPAIQLYTNPYERGVNNNFFSAIRRATGEYIAICDQDDIWEPSKLERQLKTIGEHLLCASRSQPFSTTGAAIWEDTRTPNYDLLRLLFVSGISGHTMLLSRKLLDKMPSLETIIDLRYYDVILAMVAASYHSIVYIDEPLVHHRRHTEAASFYKPHDYKMTLQNIVRNFWRTWRLYRELHPIMRTRLEGHLQFLRQIDSQEQTLADAIHLLELMTDTSWWSIFRQQWFCMQHCDKLFYAPLKKSLLTRLRGAYFPISCSEYFRYLSKKQCL